MSAEKDILQEISGQMDSAMAYGREKYPDRLWMFEIQRAYWQEMYYAHDQGKKLIMMSGNGPNELAYALDAAPFVTAPFPIRMASTPEAARYVDIAEKYLPQTFCALDKVILGLALSGELKTKPDALIYTTMPCDAERAIYPIIAEILDIPSFAIDTPYLKNERGFRYIADQLKEAATFLEGITGNTMNREKMAEVAINSNKAADLLMAIADMRKNTPCPLPGRLTVLNGLFGSMQGHPGLVDFLQAEYDEGKAALAAGKGATPGPEQFRVMWLQNHLWSNVGIMDWMEKTYNAVMVMDAFGFMYGNKINDPYDEEQFYMGVSKRMMDYPMVHGAGGPAQVWIDLVDKTIRDYKIDVSMFVGHIGCKHTWAAGKLVKDYVLEKYGIPTLTFDVDAIDMRYKSTDEIKVIISEYMDTLIEKKST